MRKTKKAKICVERKYSKSNALLLAEIQYEGPLEELNIFRVHKNCGRGKELLNHLFFLYPVFKEKKLTSIPN